MQEILGWLEGQKKDDSPFENQILQKIIEQVGEGGFDKNKFDVWLQAEIKASEVEFLANLKKEN